jgi:hypothetical protein
MSTTTKPIACAGAMDPKDGSELQDQCADCFRFAAGLRGFAHRAPLVTWRPAPRDVALHGLPCELRQPLPILTDEVSSLPASAGLCHPGASVPQALTGPGCASLAEA